MPEYLIPNPLAPGTLTVDWVFCNQFRAARRWSPTDILGEWEADHRHRMFLGMRESVRSEFAGDPELCEELIEWFRKRAYPGK
ncbi:MAG: hypothetical protein ACYTG0_06675 [Planctomycetota bacterium]|jgi:hypothetical protein